MRLGKFKILKLTAIAGLAVQVLFALPAQAAYYATAVSTSTNLLSSVSNVASIDNFHYNITTLPGNSSIAVQFSQNNSTWYSAAGVLSGSTTLSTLGGADLSLSALAWSGSNFYYKMTLNATSDLSATPTVDDVSVDYSSTSGNGQMFVVDSYGNVGIGTASPSQQLTVFNGTTTGTYTTSGWASSSDARLKTNVVGIDDALGKINALQGVAFNWKNNPDGNRQIGFIAQDVLGVLPEVVTGNEKDGFGVAYGNITALLVEGLKQLGSNIDQKNTALDAHFATLDLKTDASVTTLAGLQTSVDSNLLSINGKFTATDTVLTEQKVAFSGMQNQLADAKKVSDQLQTQIDKIKLQNEKYDALDALIAIIDPTKLVFVDTLGNLDLLDGKLEASEITAGVLTIKGVGLESPTLGVGIIKAGEDKTSINTKAVTANSRAFVTISKADRAVPIKTGILSPGVGFEVQINEPLLNDLEFNWWLVEVK